MSSDAKQLTGLQHAISGATAGVISRFFIAPLDVIKIRFQLQSTKTNVKLILGGECHNPERKYKSVIQATRIIIKEEGLTDGIYYWIPKPLHTFVSGALSGLVATTLTFPFDLLRTRFAAQGNVKIYHSLLGAITDIRKAEGIRGFYRGLLPSVASIMPQMGLVFESHRFLTSYYYLIETDNRYVGSYITGAKELVCGGLAGVFSKTMLMPFDIIRKRLQVQGPVLNAIAVSNVPKSTSVMLTAYLIIKHEGFVALYKGLLPTLLKAAPSSAITFYVVNECHKFFLK
ncbi:mitochondrial carrier domain-containing protein [Globomyces pollinis-pini]|nr:mitochondrial carrier domain-containing protein [Globomyces pollinis-pini]